MSLDYDTPDPKNPNHKGKTFILDVSAKDIETLQVAYALAKTDERRMCALCDGMHNHSLYLRDERERRIGEAGGDINIAALTSCIDAIESLTNKISVMQKELANIIYACYGRLYHYWDTTSGRV